MYINNVSQVFQEYKEESFPSFPSYPVIRTKYDKCTRKELEMLNLEESFIQVLRDGENVHHSFNVREQGAAGFMC